MTATAERRKLGGNVIHCAIRDAESIRKSNFPIYASGVTHRGPYKDGPGEINVPISLNGMVVQPGDLILGDEDGLLCVPMDCVAQIHKAAKAKHEIEAQMLSDIAADRLDTDRKSVGTGKIGLVRVDPGGCLFFRKKKK